MNVIKTSTDVEWQLRKQSLAIVAQRLSLGLRIIPLRKPRRPTLHRRPPMDDRRVVTARRIARRNRHQRKGNLLAPNP